MENTGYPRELSFTMLLEKYSDYIIEYAMSLSDGEPGKWMGHYRAYKEDAETLRGSIGTPFHTSADAQNEAIRFAKAAIDKATGGAARE